MSSKEDEKWETSKEILDVRADPYKFFTFEQIQPDVFRSIHLLTTQQAGVHAAYGGMVFSQALAAAENTVNDSFRPHAIHSFFILHVDARIPVDYKVSRTRDGRSFCTRSVNAIQRGKVAFSMQVSFHIVSFMYYCISNDAKEPSPLQHQREMPKVPAPEDCREIPDAAKQLLEEIEDGKREGNESFARLAFSRRVNHGYARKTHIFETRIVESEKYFGFPEDDEYPQTLHFWVKLRNPAGPDPKINRYLTLFYTDATLATTATRAHQGNGFRTSMIFSLDHNVWVHEPEMKADEWHLYENISTTASNGRAFVEGRWWTRDGRLVLSTTQEVLIRVPKEYKSHL